MYLFEFTNANIETDANGKYYEVVHGLKQETVSISVCMPNGASMQRVDPDDIIHVNNDTSKVYLDSFYPLTGTWEGLALAFENSGEMKDGKPVSRDSGSSKWLKKQVFGGH
ncbi:hypothetical protein BVY04_00490 [bacterium M21]|nr:hypothetical protein BVY04_00490 [bacterium M21]